MRKKSLVGFSVLTLLLAGLSVIFFATQVSGGLQCYCYGEGNPCGECHELDTCFGAWPMYSGCENYNFPARCTTRWFVWCVQGGFHFYKRYFIERIDYCGDCFTRP